MMKGNIRISSSTMTLILLDLPDECILHIFSFITPLDRLRSLRVCKYLQLMNLVTACDLASILTYRENTGLHCTSAKHRVFLPIHYDSKNNDVNCYLILMGYNAWIRGNDMKRIYSIISDKARIRNNEGLRMIRYMLEVRKDLNSTLLINGDGSDMPPILVAMIHGNYKIVDYFVSMGADFRLQYNSGRGGLISLAQLVELFYDQDIKTWLSSLHDRSTKLPPEGGFSELENKGDFLDYLMSNVSEPLQYSAALCEKLSF